MSTTNTADTTTITTASGSRYLFDGERVARLSEIPIRHADDLVLNGTPVEAAGPIVVGWAWHLRLSDGGTITTTAIVAADGPHVETIRRRG